MGKGNPLESKEALGAWAQGSFGVVTPSYTWSAQDYRAVHALPLVGAVPWGKGKIFTATGYNKWGLTNSVASSLRLAANILGGEMSWGTILDNSPNGIAQAVETAKLNLGVAKDLTAGWVNALTSTEEESTAKHGVDEEQVEPAADENSTLSQGRVVRENGMPVAVSTVAGTTRKVSGVCPRPWGNLVLEQRRTFMGLPPSRIPVHRGRLPHRGADNE